MNDDDIGPIRADRPPTTVRELAEMYDKMHDAIAKPTPDAAIAWLRSGCADDCLQPSEDCWCCTTIEVILDLQRRVAELEASLKDKGAVIAEYAREIAGLQTVVDDNRKLQERIAELEAQQNGRLGDRALDCACGEYYSTAWPRRWPAGHSGGVCSPALHKEGE